MKDVHNVNGPYPYSYDKRRKFVVITFDDGSKKSVSYPRYVMEQHLGHPLPANKDVHHKDENPSNNDISNLELVDRIKHRRDHSTKHSFEESTETCVICGKQFVYTVQRKRDYFHNTGKLVNDNPTCSKVCQCKFARQEQLRRNS